MIEPQEYDPVVICDICKHIVECCTCNQETLDYVDALRSENNHLKSEIRKWEKFHPSDEDLLEMQKQANGSQSLAAQSVYITVLEQRVRELRSENERYKTALEFYADEKNYDDEHAPVVKFREYRNYDNGAIAQSALNGGK